MNNWTGIGNLTKDVELRYSKNGTAIATGTIGVRRRFNKEKSDFIRVKVLGKSAEKYFAEYGKKGRLIAVEGELHIESWKDDQGNWNSITEVVGNVEFLDKNGSSSNESYRDDEGNSFEDLYPIDRDDDEFNQLPF